MWLLRKPDGSQNILLTMDKEVKRPITTTPSFWIVSINTVSLSNLYTKKNKTSNKLAEKIHNYFIHHAGSWVWKQILEQLLTILIKTTNLKTTNY